MTKKLWILSVPVLTLCLINLSGCKAGGKTLVRVGNENITEDDLETLARVNPRLKAQIQSPAGQKRVLDNYVDQEILFLESKRRGLGNKSDVKDKIELYTKIIIAQAVIDDELDKQARTYYEGNRDEFERAKISHIFIRTAAAEEPASPIKKDPKKPEPKAKKAGPVRSDDEALKLLQTAKDRIAKGEAFDAVAKEVSEDERTQKAGGSLNYVTLHDKRLERWGWLSLTERAFTMKTGEVSEPIKTSDGYHLIKVDEEKQLRPFEESEASIRFRIQEGARNKLLEDLKKRYKVQYAAGSTPETRPVSPAAPAGEPNTAPAAPESAPAAPVTP